MSVEPIDGTRTVQFVAAFVMNDKEQTKTFASRADLFSWVRGAEMFNVIPKSINRTVSQAVIIKRSV